MNYGDTAKELLKAVGGPENIRTLTHCMTRMRFVLKNESAVSDKTVKAIPGVLGVARKGGQYQVIIGNDVTQCYQEFMKLGNFGQNGEEPTENKKKEKLSVKGIVNGIIDAIAGSIAPILPAIIGCGMVRLVVTILDLLNVSAELPTYQILTVIGDAGFYFLPILLAASAAEKFKCSKPLAMTLAAILVHPTLVSMLAEGSTTFLKIPVTAATYSSSVIPVLLITWVLSKIEPVMDRYLKGWSKTIFKPLLVLIIGAPIALIILAPVGTFLGDGLAWILTWLQDKAGWLTIGLLSAFMPLVVMAGMHYALIPNCLTTLGLYGFETLLGPTMLASNFSQAAASAAVALKSKDKDMKALALTSSVSAFVAGITEPALYGVTMKLKKPLIASMIGSGCAGLFAGIVGLQNYALITPSLVAVVQFVSADLPRNILYAVITMVISVVVTFVLTLILGWEEAPAEDKKENIETEEIREEIYRNVTDSDVTSPLTGKIVPLSSVEDETFAGEILGKGTAVLPSEGKVYAPFDGTVQMVFDTKHAMGLSSDSGIELLIHVGLETVNLGGEGFHPLVKDGEKIKRGQLLMEYDLPMLKEKGYDTVTPVIVTNSDDFKEITVLSVKEEVTKKDKILLVKKD